MTRNPFRDAITTFDLLPRSLRPQLIPALFEDWADLQSNANPIMHSAARNATEAVEYVDEWGHVTPMLYVDLQRQLLLDLAAAWDSITPHLPADDTTEFGGEKISEGQYLDVRDLFGQIDAIWDAFNISKFDDYTVTFRIEDYDEITSETKTVEYPIHIVNHQIHTHKD